MDQDITPELAKSFGTKVTKGVIVAAVVPGSPAEKGGLKRWDIIESLNGKQIENVNMLSLFLPAMGPGSPTTIEVIRDGKPVTVKLTIGSLPR
jgi:S1-C subfamily serine protease